MFEERLSKLYIKTKFFPSTYFSYNYEFQYKTFAYMENSFGKSQSKTFESIQPHLARTIVFYLNKTVGFVICEVEIYNLKSLSLRKPTDQKTSISNGLSKEAVNGETCWIHNRNDLFCTHIEEILNNWWRVNLENKSIIYSVSIIGRDHAIYRRNNLLLSLSDSKIDEPTINPENVCGFIQSQVPIYSTTRCKK